MGDDQALGIPSRGPPQNQIPTCDEQEIFVAWISQEVPDSYRVKVRYGVRNNALPSLWVYGEIDSEDLPGVGGQSSKHVSVGFDRAHEWFLITSLTPNSLPYIAVVDQDGEQVATSLIATQPVMDVGKPVCGRDGAEESRCVIPYTIASDLGLHAGWFDGFVDDAGGFVVLDQETSDVVANGRVDLAHEPTMDGIEEFRGTAGDRRFLLDAFPGVGATNDPVAVSPFQSDGWPLRVANLERGENLITYRLFARLQEPPFECGNGVVECDEQCDGDDFDGETCGSLGEGVGNLACTEECEFDTSDCSPPPPGCGDGVRQQDEECDGTDLGGATCSSVSDGDLDGDLGCAEDCKLDLQNCMRDTCGNGVLDPDEQCDPSANERSADYCSPTACVWTSCDERPNNGVGTEGCECFEPGEAFSDADQVFNEGDTCAEPDLVCRFGPNHAGKRCMRCPAEGNVGRGCPCGSPGESCQLWDPSTGGPDLGACLKDEIEPKLECFGAAPIYVDESGTTEKNLPNPIARCWDATDPPRRCDAADCQVGQECVAGECVWSVCQDSTGRKGICEAMNMTCDPSKTDILGNPGVCINTDNCSVPGVETNTGGCIPDETKRVNESNGVPRGQWCPGPFQPNLP